MLGLSSRGASPDTCNDPKILLHQGHSSHQQIGRPAPPDTDPTPTHCESANGMNPPQTSQLPQIDRSPKSPPDVSPDDKAGEETQTGGANRGMPQKFFPLFARGQKRVQDDASDSASASQNQGRSRCKSSKIPAIAERPQQHPATRTLEEPQGKVSKGRTASYELDIQRKPPKIPSGKAVEFFAPRRRQRGSSPASNSQQSADVRPACDAPWPGAHGVPNSHVRQLAEGVAARRDTDGVCRHMVRHQSGYWSLRSGDVNIAAFTSKPSSWRPPPTIEHSSTCDADPTQPEAVPRFDVGMLLQQFDEAFADACLDMLRPCIALRKRMLDGVSETGETRAENTAPTRYLPDSYGPHGIKEILGSKSRGNAQAIVNWLEQWPAPLPKNVCGWKAPSAKPPKKSTKKRRRKKKRMDGLDDFIVEDSETDFFSSSEEDEGRTRPLPVIVLVGPSGSGKTSAVHAAARDAGYDVFEVHPGMKRSAKELLTLVGEVTQNHVMAGWDVREKEKIWSGAESEQAKSVTVSEMSVTASLDASSDSGLPTLVNHETRTRKRRKGQRNTARSDLEPDPFTVTRNKSLWARMGFAPVNSTPASAVPIDEVPSSPSVPANLPIVNADSPKKASHPNASREDSPQPEVPEPTVKTLRLVASSSAKPLLILLEEADITYEDDQAFWKAVATLAERNRRPIVITCNTLDGLNHCLVGEYLFATLTFEPIPLKEMIPYIYMVSVSEGIVPQLDHLKSLCKLWHGDIRRILSELTFWRRRAVYGSPEIGVAGTEGDGPEDAASSGRSIGNVIPPLSSLLFGMQEGASNIFDLWPEHGNFEPVAALGLEPTDLFGDWADALPQLRGSTQSAITTTSDGLDAQSHPQPPLGSLPALASDSSRFPKLDQISASLSSNGGDAGNVPAATATPPSSGCHHTILGLIDFYLQFISHVDASIGVKRWREEQIRGMDSYEPCASDRSSRPTTLHKRSLPGTLTRLSGAPDHDDLDVQITWLLNLGARRALARHSGSHPPPESGRADVVAAKVVEAIARRDAACAATEAATESAWFTLQELGVPRSTGLDIAMEPASQSPAVLKALWPLFTTASAMRTGVDFYPQMVYYAGLIARADKRNVDEIIGDTSRRRRNGRIPLVPRHISEDLQDFEVADAFLRFAECTPPGSNVQ